MSKIFSEGQRVRVLALDNNQLRQRVLAKNIKYQNRIGYVSDTESDSDIEIIITKIGERVRLPEWCLESAELHKY